jgi:hypothetical protein
MTDDVVFNIGDVCYLKSGSPPLIVIDIIGDRIIVAFNLECLELYQELDLSPLCLRKLKP